MNNFASFNGRLSNYHNYELDLEYLLLILKRGGGVVCQHLLCLNLYIPTFKHGTSS